MKDIISWKNKTIIRPSTVYSDMPNSVYHSLTDWNGSSMLKNALRSVESYLYEKEQPQKHTLALERGSALHWCLEALTTAGLVGENGHEYFDEKIMESPTQTIDSKGWREMKQEYPGCFILPEADRRAVFQMAGNIWAKGDRLGLLKSGYSELSFFWIDGKTGLKCKCRPDWIDFENFRMSDYKTTKSHNRDGFGREMMNYKYHLSAAFYREGIFQVTGVDIREFIIIACANTPPFEVSFYPVGANSIIEGDALFRYALDKIADYADEKEPIIETPLDIPFYGFKLTDPNEI